VSSDGGSIQCCGGQVVSAGLVCCGDSVTGQSYVTNTSQSCCGLQYVDISTTHCCTDQHGHSQVDWHSCINYVNDGDVNKTFYSRPKSKLSHSVRSFSQRQLYAVTNWKHCIWYWITDLEVKMKVLLLKMMFELSLNEVLKMFSLFCHDQNQDQDHFSLFWCVSTDEDLGLSRLHVR